MITEVIQKNFPLAQLSTFKIGGPAEFFVATAEKSELEEAVAWAKEHALPITVLGGGSNILVNDDGVKGLVIKVDTKRLDFQGDTVIAGASVDMWDVSKEAFERGLSGIEWAIGIPGSVGGAIRGNAGAHGGSLDKVVRTVIAFDYEAGEWKTFATDECGFAYRSSRFKAEPHYIIWEVEFKLAAGERTAMEEAIRGYKQYRTDSQPKEPSAGCIFKNFFAKDIEAVNAALYADAQKDNKVRGGKIGAGYLVQKLGLMGTQAGGAVISPKHANFIVNTGNATAADVRAIIAKVKHEVKEAYGVDMEEEVQYVGF